MTLKNKPSKKPENKPKGKNKSHLISQIPQAYFVSLTAKSFWKKYRNTMPSYGVGDSNKTLTCDTTDTMCAQHFQAVKCSANIERPHLRCTSTCQLQTQSGSHMACTSCHHKHKALDAFTLRQQLHHRDYATMQQRNAIARTLPAKLGRSSSAPVVMCVSQAQV